MPDIVINPSLGKIDFFTVKGEQVTNSMRLGDASTILFTGALSASSITTGGGGAFVTSVQPTANYLSKFTGNSTIANSLVYDNGTNVGIGTTVPSASLHINSTTAGATLLRTDGTNGTLFSVVDDLSDSLMSVNNSAGLPVLEVFTDDRIVAGQYGQNDFVVVNNKVGIGTNNPLAKLHVSSSASIPSAIFMGGNVGIGTSTLTTKFNVYDASSGNVDEVFLGTIGTDQLVGGRTAGSFGIATKSASNGNLIFTANNGMYFRTSGSNDRMFIKNDGNVGIGTTAPGYKLHVYNSAATDTTLESGTSGTTGKLIFKTSDNADLNKYIMQESFYMILNGHTNEGFKFRDSAGNVLLSIYGAANAYGKRVGINTITPGAPLEVSGPSGDNTPTFKITSTSAPASFNYAGSMFNSSLSASNYILMMGKAASSKNAGYIGYNHSGTDGSNTNFLTFGHFASDNLLNILGNGNVGIGTTSPAAKLHVVGSSILSNNATINPDSYTGIVAGNIADGSGWGALGIGGNNGNTGRSFGMGVSGTTFYMGFQNGSTTSSLQTFLAVSGSRNLFLVPDGGNVGIGTTSPLQKLHVLGNISTISQASSGEETNRLQFYNIGAATYDIASIRAFVGAGQANRGELGFYVNNGASQQLAMYIDRSQNVGIGTTSPLERITFGSSDSIIARSSDTEFNSGYCSRILFNQGGTGYGYLGFYTYQGGSGGGERMRITESGNVGIGTTSPNAKLDVNGNTIVTGSLTVTSTIVARNYIMATDTLYIQKGVGGYQSYITAEQTAASTGNSFKFWNSGTATLMTIGYDGNVGIGTTSPQYLLDLGTAGSANQLRARRIYVSGTGTGSGFTLESTLIYQEAAGTFNITNPGSYPNVAFTINNSGNVGIGTTSPVARLAVTPSGSAFDSSNTMVAYFGKTTANGYGSTFIRVARSDSTTTTGSNAEYTDIEHNSGGATPFRYGTYTDTNIINGGAATNGVYGSINFVTSDSTRMTIAGGTSAGNVGIGTTNPAAMLHVQKSQNSETTVIINNTDAGTAAAARLDLQSHASNYLTLQAYGQNFSGNVCGIAGAKLNTILDNALTANSTGLLIGTTSTNPLYFATANAERMRIDSGGNVGIGTTTPFGTNANRTVLSVNGTTDVSLNIGSGGSQRAYLYGVSSYAELGTIGSLPLSFAPNNSEKMRLDVNGNLGIGTTSPAAKLYVVSSGGPIARFDGSSVATSGATEIDILGPQSNGDLNLGIGGSTFTDATNNIQNKAYITAGTGLSGLNLRSDAGYVQITAGGLASSYEVARFTSAGNVGIGTTVTAAKLHINSTTAGATLLRTDGTNGTLFSVVDDLSDSLMSVNNSAGLPVLEVFADDRIVGGQYGQNDLVVVNNKVGIGTNNPLAKLHVTGSASVPAAVFMGNVGIGTTSPSTKLHIYENANRVTYISQNDNHTARFEAYGTATAIDTTASNGIFFRINGSDIVKFAANGNVGIGFTSPAANLHVFGPTMIVGDSNTTQNVRQTIVGSTTGNASTTAKKIFVCGHTSTGTINVTAIITSVSTASATATFSFANAYGNNVTPNRLSYISLNSTITSIDCSYNNSGYQMEIAVTYTGATAPTLYFTAEGMGSSIWTL